ncbi:MAG: hypothetical protein ACKOA2_03815 [Ilumatobacteraceae bacterium]
MTRLWRLWMAIAAAIVVVFGGLPASMASSQRPVLAWLSTSTASCEGAPSAGPRGAYGLVTYRQLDATHVEATVHISGGVPNERYTVNRTCVGSVGDVYTDATGGGVARMEFYSGTAFAIDVHLYCVGNRYTCGDRWGEKAQTTLQVLDP